MPGPGSGHEEHEFKRRQLPELPPDLLCEVCGKGKAVTVSDFEPYTYLCAKCDTELQGLE